ncbi:MAG TPA: thiamine pyrophosphate-binding protein [Solirubrobacteraceae bacterium]|nr:thiamine pyrophosphate-binding protein [Solirubrobacteraceae bacterium]
MSEVEVSSEQAVNGPEPSVSGHGAKDSSARQDSSVADVVGATIAAQGVKDAFGILGSGNLVVTNALVRHGARFHHARHEMSAVCMADGYARVTGGVGVASVHQGPGLTNTMTGLAEAAKSRTPLLILSGETPAAALTSNFRIDQHDLVESVGAIADRVHGASTAADDAARAYQRAMTEWRPVVLMLPIDIQPQSAVQTAPSRPPLPRLDPPEPAPDAVRRAADLLRTAQRPAIIAGRGAVLSGAGPALEDLGATIGAILATSAPANGLFAGLPFALGISGGFASPFAAQTLPQADVVLVAGASVNHWTTKHGALIAPTAKVIQIDIDPRAIGRNRPADAALIADVDAAAKALRAALGTHHSEGFRTPELSTGIANNTWRHDPYEDASTDEWIDPRTVSIALNDLLPHNKAVAVDSGHFLGYPSMFLDVPDARSWLFPNGFQAVGLGLGNAIGAAIANPDRPTVAAIGDGGAFMALAELETAARLKLTLLVVIYDDAAYGAEVHHFAPMGHDVSLVRFPDADLAGIARAAGAKAATVRRTEDLSVIEDWLANPHGPLVLDVKVNPTICAEWLEEAFRAG